MGGYFGSFDVRGVGQDKIELWKRINNGRGLTIGERKNKES